MTANQVAYQQMVRQTRADEEQKRANLAREAETERHNKYSEKSDRMSAVGSFMRGFGGAAQGASSIIDQFRKGSGSKDRLSKMIGSIL